ncbi:MAG: BrnA antitoxin family protein [Leptothrix sp. (in: b-proteobacteria)]
MSETSKTRTGRVLQLPTPEEDATINAAAQADPDAVPFTDAEWAQVKPMARRGRPLGSGTKTQITLRLDSDLVNEFKATGPGWQTRINALLREAVEGGKVKA